MREYELSMFEWVYSRGGLENWADRGLGYLTAKVTPA